MVKLNAELQEMVQQLKQTNNLNESNALQELRNKLTETEQLIAKQSTDINEMANKQIEAIKSEQPLQKCSEIEETVKREFILWVTEFQLQMKYYVQDLKRKERYNKMEQNAIINGDL